MTTRDDQTGSAVKEKVELKKQEPTLYNVILLNDDYTTMEFVMQILETLFQKSPAEAYRIMMHVHRNGRGLAGVYTFEVAETKAEQVASLASEAGYPLRATIEEA
jgi:ATP-dependent Clp protease adaptor protein ClpS